VILHVFFPLGIQFNLYSMVTDGAVKMSTY